MIGVLLNNQWSVGGNPLRPAVNAGLAQPFVNYNMAHGWYLTSSPIITVNWLAASGEKWTVPVGGGFGRVFRVGDQPVNASIQAYYNVDASDRRIGLDIAHLGRASVPGEITKREMVRMAARIYSLDWCRVERTTSHIFSGEFGDLCFATYGVCRDIND